MIITTIIIVMGQQGVRTRKAHNTCAAGLKRPFTRLLMKHCVRGVNFKRNQHTDSDIPYSFSFSELVLIRTPQRE